MSRQEEIHERLGDFPEAFRVAAELAALHERVEALEVRGAIVKDGPDHKIAGEPRKPADLQKAQATEAGASRRFAVGVSEAHDERVRDAALTEVAAKIEEMAREEKYYANLSPASSEVRGWRAGAMRSVLDAIDDLRSAPAPEAVTKDELKDRKSVV